MRPPPSDNFAPRNQQKEMIINIQPIIEEAGRQLRHIVSNTDTRFTLLSPELKKEAVTSLRPLAQKTILYALEGRTLALETVKEGNKIKSDWEDMLDEMEPSKDRAEFARYILSHSPEFVAALNDPVVQRRNVVEWLFDQTVTRIEQETPYLVREDEELATWQRDDEASYKIADNAARRFSSEMQNRTRPVGGGDPKMTEMGRELAYKAHMMAARKIFLLVTAPKPTTRSYKPSAPSSNEYFGDRFKSITLKLSEKTPLFDYAKAAYINMGLNPGRCNYKDMLKTPLQHEVFTKLVNSVSLQNLQAAICPWTGPNSMLHKMDTNILAQAYNMVRSRIKEPGVSQLHQPTYEALKGNIEQYKLFGFRDDITAEQAAVLEKFIDDSPSLQSFLSRPSVQEAFMLHRVDQSVVQTCLDASITFELIDSVKASNLRVNIEGTTKREQALNVIDAIVHDTQTCYTAMVRRDHLDARQGSYVETLTNRYIAGLPEKEQAKLKSFYTQMAIVVYRGNDNEQGAIPADWKKLNTYNDVVTGKEMTDYAITSGDDKAVICLAKGASPSKAFSAAEDLWDLEHEPQIKTQDVIGVRLSERNFNEFKSSYLYPITIARMQFYTSYSMDKTLKRLVPSAGRPSPEQTIEALKPSLVLDYQAEGYGRAKAAEPVKSAMGNVTEGPKYRTPNKDKLTELGLTQPLEKEPDQATINVNGVRIVLNFNDTLQQVLAKIEKDTFRGVSGRFDPETHKVTFTAPRKLQLAMPDDTCNLFHALGIKRPLQDQVVIDPSGASTPLTVTSEKELAITSDTVTLGDLPNFTISNSGPLVARNPCWDATKHVNEMTSEELAKRYEDTSVPLIVIEGEKKAAMLAQMMQELNLPFHVLSLPGVAMGIVDNQKKGVQNRRRLAKELAQFKMSDKDGNKRDVMILFDNDKAFKAPVTLEMIKLARVIQKEGANVFIPNIPPGKYNKGIDDFRAICSSWQPTVDILNNAILMPNQDIEVKFPFGETVRQIDRYLNESETTMELQKAVAASKDPLNSPDFKKLFLVQVPYHYSDMTEQAALNLFEKSTTEEKAVLLATVMKGNPALKNLYIACAGIPKFETGITYKQKQENPAILKTQSAPAPVGELFALA